MGKKANFREVLSHPLRRAIARSIVDDDNLGLAELPGAIPEMGLKLFERMADRLLCSEAGDHHGDAGRSAVDGYERGGVHGWRKTKSDGFMVGESIKR
jgi:hypothetical protein